MNISVRVYINYCSHDTCTVYSYKADTMILDTCMHVDHCTRIRDHSIIYILQYRYLFITCSSPPVCVKSLDCLVGMPATTSGDLHGKLHEEKLKYLVAELHFTHKEVRTAHASPSVHHTRRSRQPLRSIESRDLIDCSRVGTSSRCTNRYLLCLCYTRASSLVRRRRSGRRTRSRTMWWRSSTRSLPRNLM